MKKTTLFILSLLFVANVFAQEEKTTIQVVQEKTKANEESINSLKKLKVSGYVQTQIQFGEKDAKIGTGNVDKSQSYNTIGIRRGRIKFSYSESIVTGVFQLDITEKGVSFKDAYFNIIDPWFGSIQFKTGIFDRPFGHEVAYSSSQRESPERSNIAVNLFPDERDLGACLILQTPKGHFLNFLKLELAAIAGNGIKQETDCKRDYIAHLTANKNIGSDVKWGLGISYYNGKVLQTNKNSYEMDGTTFKKVAVDSLSYAKREYFGVEAQFSYKTPFGLSQIRGEYLWGQQPGVINSTKSPNSSTASLNINTYIRKFSGFYAIFTQELYTLPLTAVIKYDLYDPNTDVKGDNIGKIEVAGTKATNSADMYQTTLGLGMLWKINHALKLTAYYDINKYEDSANEHSYQVKNSDGSYSDKKFNVFTLRLQYKF